MVAAAQALFLEPYSKDAAQLRRFRDAEVVGTARSSCVDLRTLPNLQADLILVGHARLVRQPVSHSDAAPGVCAGSGASGHVECCHGGTDAKRGRRGHQLRRSLPRVRYRYATRWAGSKLQGCLLLDRPCLAAAKHRIGTAAGAGLSGSCWRDRHGYHVGSRSPSAAGFSPLVRNDRARPSRGRA
jgi:hypothetical protein